MRGFKKIVLFCVLIAILPTFLVILPLYLRHSLYSSVVYAVSESDVIEIDDGISTIFCSEHTLKMNTSFNAFKMTHLPKMSKTRKHVRLKKSMTLPDDTLEYWGFYLLKGSTVALSVCSRFQGSSILVVKGERNLRTCGMLEHNKKKQRADNNLLPEQTVKVTFETHAQEIKSNEIINEVDTLPPVSTASWVENIDPVSDNNSIVIDTPMTENHYVDRKYFESTTAERTGGEAIPANSVDKELESLHLVASSYIQKHGTQNDAEAKDSDKGLKFIKKKIHEVLMNKMETIYASGSEPEEVLEKQTIDSGILTEFKDDRNRLAHELAAELDSDADMNEVEDLISNERDTIIRRNRSPSGVKPKMLLDRGPEHGGNANNVSHAGEESSVSSFENGLRSCYDGQVLLAQEFEPSDLCVNVNFLINTKHMQTRHDVIENGYYYYIFYSDNDFVSNDMHAIFDIYKPSFEYENVGEKCINTTECFFSLGFLSGDLVIVEIPMKNGIEHKETDINLLVSTCHPRMGLYAVFPIAAILLILGFAFI